MQRKGTSRDHAAIREHIIARRLEFAPHAHLAGLNEHQVRAAMNALREPKDIRIRAGELPEGTAPPWARPDAWLILTAGGTIIPDPRDPVKPAARK